MVRTTVYLPEDLKAALERVAAAERCTEAEIIRDSLRRAIEERRHPKPRVPLTGEGLGDPRAAERVDELLADFGR